MTKIDLSIIIVNYNGAAFIRECLDTLFASKVSFTYEVIIVDNDSKDNSLEVLKDYQDRIILLANDNNVGFAQGNNQAIKICNGTSVFLLNNDTILFENTLQTLWDFHKQNLDAVITPKLLNKDKTLQSPGSMWGSWRFKATKPRKVPFIAGAAVIMTKETYWAMGGLDENLFFYNDDIDMCKTLVKMGRPIYYYPQSEIIHVGGLSTKFRRVGSLIEGYRGGIYLSLKHYGPIRSIIYRVLLMVDLLPKIMIYALLSPFSKNHRDFLGGYVHIFKINLLGDVYMPSRPTKTRVSLPQRS